MTFRIALAIGVLASAGALIAPSLAKDEALPAGFTATASVLPIEPAVTKLVASEAR